MFQGGKASSSTNKKARKISGKLKPIDLDENVTVRRWLARNSLRALKLTILDALEPTLVKQTPEHVKILDKYVESKVWNDVSVYTEYRKTTTHCSNVCRGSSVPFHSLLRP